MTHQPVSPLIPTPPHTISPSCELLRSTHHSELHLCDTCQQDSSLRRLCTRDLSLDTLDSMLKSFIKKLRDPKDDTTALKRLISCLSLSNHEIIPAIVSLTKTSHPHPIEFATFAFRQLCGSPMPFAQLMAFHKEHVSQTPIHEPATCPSFMCKAILQGRNSQEIVQLDRLCATRLDCWALHHLRAGSFPITWIQTNKNRVKGNNEPSPKPCEQQKPSQPPTLIPHHHQPFGTREAMQECVLGNQTKLLQLLVSQVDTFDLNMVRLACSLGHVDCMRVLLACHEDPGYFIFPLMTTACSANQIQAIEFLLQQAPAMMRETMILHGASAALKAGSYRTLDYLGGVFRDQRMSTQQKSTTKGVEQFDITGGEGGSQTMTTDTTVDATANTVAEPSTNRNSVPTTASSTSSITASSTTPTTDTEPDLDKHTSTNPTTAPSSTPTTAPSSTPTTAPSSTPTTDTEPDNLALAHLLNRYTPTLYPTTYSESVNCILEQLNKADILEAAVRYEVANAKSASPLPALDMYVQAHSSNLAPLVQVAVRAGNLHTTRELLFRGVPHALDTTINVESLLSLAPPHSTKLIAYLCGFLHEDPAALRSQALSKAIKHNNVALLKELESTVDFSMNNQGPLREAVKHGHVDVVDFLLSHASVHPNTTYCSVSAAEHGNIRVLHRLLLDERVDPFDLTAEDLSKSVDGVTGFQLLLSTYRRSRAFYELVDDHKVSESETVLEIVACLNKHVEDGVAMAVDAMAYDIPCDDYLNEVVELARW